MTTILRFILFFLLAPAFVIVAQAAGTAQDDFRIVDVDFQTQSVILDTLDGEICNYDSSGALLQQHRSIAGKAADEDDDSRDVAIESSEAAQPLFSFLAEFVAAKGGDDYLVSFMGSNGRNYYDNASATLGAPGGSVWVAPMDDLAGISNRAGVVTGTGHAPGPLQSYLRGDSIYGIAIPRSSVSLRLPSAADAGANQHFRLGGFTGVEHNGVWKSSNVREFIVDGGSSVPKGSVFFEFGADGSWIPIRKF